MKIRFNKLPVLFLVFFFSGFLGPLFSENPSEKSPQTIRFLLSIGVNNGGNNREVLRYAVSDAISFFNLFRDIGGVIPQNAILAQNPDRNNFLSSLNLFSIKVKNAKKVGNRVEVVFYYSGHSDENGFLLGNDRVTYKELRSIIDNLPADVKIVILDSCSSGAFTRAKGGKMKSPFLNDSSYNMKGYAFMTSSSSDESSQESDSIKGSFFTHYLISGLRGAADVTMDKKITLNEVYQYAYNETLSRTQKTWNGPQHPNYAIEMSGTGDVILTDIRKSSALVQFHKYLEGRLTIQDNNGIVIGEFFKPFGSNLEFGMDPGTYEIHYKKGNDIFSSLINLSTGQSVVISEKSFKKINKEHTSSRGNPAETSDETQSIFTWDKLTITGYGAPVFRIMNFNSSPGILAGGKGGILINYALSVGGEGYGLVSPITGPGLGGFFLEYCLFPRKVFSLSAAIMFGAGNYSDSTKTFSENFRIASPEINAYLTILPSFKIGIGVSYFYPLPFDRNSIHIHDLQGFSFGIFFLFGRF